MTAPSAYPWSADTRRLRVWFVVYLVVWALGLYAAFSNSARDATPYLYALLVPLIPYVGCIVYSYRVQRELNRAGVYRPGAWQVIAGALILSPVFLGLVIPVSVLLVSGRITRAAPQLASPGSPGGPFVEPQEQLPAVPDLPGALAAEHANARWTTYLLYACLALSLVAIGSGVLQRSLLLRIAAGEHLAPGVAAANDSRHAAIALLQVLALFVTGVMWLFWLHRAYANLGAVGARRARFTPGWAVGYWFIPLMNLVRPYQIVVDLWQRSERGNADAAVDHLPRPSLLALWWGVYLLNAFADRFAAALGADAHTASQLIASTDVSMLGDVIGAVAALLAVAVVRGIDERQQRLAAPAPSAPIS